MKTVPAGEWSRWRNGTFAQNVRYGIYDLHGIYGPRQSKVGGLEHEQERNVDVVITDGFWRTKESMKVGYWHRVRTKKSDAMTHEKNWNEITDSSNLLARCQEVLAEFEAEALYGDYPPKTFKEEVN